jgi:hypothetical protein
MRALVVLAALVRIAHGECAHDKKLPVARGSIDVDGKLSDPVWKSACWADDFAEQQPHFGAKPSHPVKVAIAVDATTLYVAARMWSAPGEVDDALTQRDDTQQAERFIISIDPSHTRRVAYSFAVTAAGARADWIHTDDTEGARDYSWDPVWIAKTEILTDGWTAEMAIPLSQLRLPRTPAASWGINFDWYIPHTNEDVFWIPVPLDKTAWASYFGELTELPPIVPGLGLELLPYAATSTTIAEDLATRLSHRWRGEFEAGLDLKLRPLPGLTVNATINPDFGQVDADPAFVNLTAYEVLLPEKRPFFVANNTLFNDDPSGYFYSRRIGALPRVLPGYDDIDLPNQVRILGAVAAGGYVASRTQIAVLGAITDSATADAIVGGARKSLVVAPLSVWSAGRVEHQVGPSIFGLTATAVGRSLDNTGLAPLLASSALVAGGDAQMRSDDRTYELDFVGGLSDVNGSAAAISSIEQTSAHYFQRPDQSYVHVDTDAHHLLGWHAGAYTEKRAGLWRGNVFVNTISPGLELNDIGQLQSADHIDVTGEIRRAQTTPGDHVLDWDLYAGGGESWNFGALRRPGNVHLGTDVTFASFDNISALVRASTPGTDDTLTRGGPRMQVGGAGALVVAASTPPGRARELSATLELDASPTLQQGVIASASAMLRVLPSLRLDLTPSFTAVETHRQYVATVDDPMATATYGAHYLFGHLHRKDAALELRATWSLSPDLVLTVYAQPFVSVGRYDQIGELVAPGSADVRWLATSHSGATRTVGGLSIGEPDYRVASLRSTAVLRWELTPGSILYIVWQQDRGGVPALPAQTLHATAPELFTQPAVHTLAVKLSYWFG